MYRCRRLLAILLSLAVVASTFIFSASAEEFDYNRIILQFDNRSISLNDGASFTKTLNKGNSYTFEMVNVIARGLNSGESLAVNFKLRLYVLINGQNQDSNGSINCTNMNTVADGKFLVNYIFEARDPAIFEPNILNPTSYVINCSFVFTDALYHNIPFHIDVINSSATNNFVVYWIVEDFTVISSLNHELNSVIKPAIDGVKACIDFANGKLFSDSFSYTEISYDQQGNASTVDKSGNWITAILGTLNSLLAPVQKQVEEEQMAKDAGFNDVLDDAYGSSSPGSLIDILDIGDLATWDEGSWEDSMGDSFLYWFSQSCADDIDTVPRTRVDEPEIIDFYSQHINDYWEALGIGTADQGGD